MIEVQIRALVQAAIEKCNRNHDEKHVLKEKNAADVRLKQIEQIITKLYMDNAEGHITDERLHSMVQKLEGEAGMIRSRLAELSGPPPRPNRGSL